MPPSENEFENKDLSNGLTSTNLVQQETRCTLETDNLANLIADNTNAEKIIFKADTEILIDEKENNISSSDMKLTSCKNGYIAPLDSDINELKLSSINSNVEILVGNVEKGSYSGLSSLHNEENDHIQTKQDFAFDNYDICDTNLTRRTLDNGSDTLYSNAVSMTIRNSKDIDESEEDYQVKISNSSGEYENKDPSYTIHEIDNIHDSKIPKDASPADVESTEINQSDDDFGDFDAAFGESNKNKTTESIFSTQNESMPDFNATTTNSDEPVFDESDDDFGDFGEVVTPQFQRDMPSTIAAVGLGNNTLTHSTEAILNSVSQLG